MSAQLDDKVKEYVKAFGEGISFGYHKLPEQELIAKIEQALAAGEPLPSMASEFDAAEG